MQQVPGKRINPHKNYSSQERTYGLDYQKPEIKIAPSTEQSDRQSSPSQDPNNPFNGGKRQYGQRNNSQQNLLIGHYGFDPVNHSPNRNKPYSKQYQAIDKP